MSVRIETDSNFASVHFDKLTIHISYKTVIGFENSSGRIVRENAWGPTTGKHMNAIDGGSALAKAARIPGPEFEKRLAAVLKAHDLSY